MKTQEPKQNCADEPARSKKPQKRKKRRRLIIFFAAFLILAAGCAAWAASQVRPPEQQPAPVQTDPVIVENNENSDSDRPSTAVQSAAAAGLSLRDGVYTLMLIGQRDGNTDTLMVAMLDTDQGVMNVVSIPRDTVVDVSRRIPKINGAYNSGGGGTDGIAQLMSEMSQIIGYVPGSYACVNMQGFVDLVDAIGGVEFNVPVRMKKLSEGINLQPGEQTLSGDDALALVRYRGYSHLQTDTTGIDHDDYGRMQVQQMFLKAVADQALTLGNIGKIPEFLKIADKNLTTDLTDGNLAWFARQLLEIGTQNLHFYTLPTVSVDYSGSDALHGYYENIVHDKAMETINSYINPYDGTITDSMVTHRQLG